MRVAAAALLFIIPVVFAPPASAQAQRSASAAVRTSRDPARTVEIVADDNMKYSVTTIRARAGEVLQVRLVSKGILPKIAMAHNFVLLKPDTNIDLLLKDGAPHRGSDFIPPSMAGAVIARTGFAGPGEVVQVTFTVPLKPGRYPYICTFSGHHQGGMRGILIVR